MSALKASPKVQIHQVEAYLQSRNWLLDSEIRKVGTVWHRSDSPDAEVILPQSDSVKDAAPRLREALLALASFEARPISELIDEIAGLSANIITVRVISGDTAGGTIPIEDGVLLIKRAKDLLYSASMSLYAKRRLFQGPPPKDARAYMESLLLGQTEVGSYVVNVIAPVDATPVELPDGTAMARLSEVVTHNLIQGLEALSEAADTFHKTENLMIFEWAVAKGVSANMCDALLGFSGKARDRDFEIKVSGAAGPMFGREARTFVFDAFRVAALEQAAGYYKNDYVLRDREIIGFVKHLRRAKGEEVGTVTVDARVGDVERSVQIVLGPDEYHHGVLAHDRKALICCRGDIHVKNRTTRLLNPAGFRLLDQPGLFEGR